jgi:hypothetical protein
MFINKSGDVEQTSRGEAGREERAIEGILGMTDEQCKLYIILWILQEIYNTLHDIFYKIHRYSRIWCTSGWVDIYWIIF